MPPRGVQRVMPAASYDADRIRGLLKLAVERLKRSSLSKAESRSSYAIYVALKRLWWAEERTARAAIRKDITPPVRTWQRWFADPFNGKDNPDAPDLLVDGINHGDGSFRFAYFYPHETKATKVLSFHTAAIVSPQSWHNASVGRAWLCFESASDQGGVRHANGSVASLPALLYGVSTNLAPDVADRELLAYHSDLPAGDQSKLLAAIRKVVESGGDRIDELSGGVTPGTIVKVKSVHASAAYHAFVLATWNRFPNFTDQNPVLLAQIVPLPAGLLPSEEAATKRSCVVLSGGSGVRYLSGPALINLRSLRPVKRELLETAGKAEPLLKPVRSLFSKILEEVTV